MDLLEIDGSMGEGGGQIVRSSLALSLVTGRPFRLINIRGKRKKSGLLKQHLTALLAASAIGHAQVEGAEIRSNCFVFRPDTIRSGSYHFRIGTAGSTMLVLQTVLPALLIAPGESHLTLEGGTHNPFAPPFDFLEKTYLPLIARMGPTVHSTLKRPGFYPKGGGSLDIHIEPVESLGPLDLIDRGPITSQRVRVLQANLPRHIAERECKTIAEKTGWPPSSFTIDEEKRAQGSGNVVMIELESANLTEVVTAFGKIGLSAEKVAKNALSEAQRYIESDVPVGEHLADQLILPLGIGAFQGTGGGTFQTSSLSDHAKTHLKILTTFLKIHTEVIERAQDEILVRILPETEKEDSKIPESSD